MESAQQTATPIAAEEAIGEAFMIALAERSRERLQVCVHPDVRLRALVPSGFQESEGFEAVIARLESWFGYADRIEVLKKEIYHVSNRLHIRYRFGEHYSDGDLEVIEQDAYCFVHDGQIAAIDLLCSGHLPAPEKKGGEVHHFDAGELGCGSGLPEEFRRQIGAVPVGSVLEVVTRDPAAKEDLPSLARLLGHQVLSVRMSPEGATVIAVQRER
jgi:TusA-related sulfurtransferase